MKYLARTLGTALLSASLLTGCLTPAAITPTRYYTVSPTPVEMGEVASTASLGLRPLVAARPYKLEIAYQAESNRLAYFSQAEWAELPGTMVSRALADSIVHSRLFRDAGEATDMARPDYVFTGELRRFDADYTGDTPEFVASISASIRGTTGGTALWQEQFEVRTPLDTPLSDGATDDVLADIARAASDTVNQLSQETCARIRVALVKSATK